jgi:hypothetical protein
MPASRRNAQGATPAGAKPTRLCLADLPNCAAHLLHGLSCVDLTSEPTNYTMSNSKTQGLTAPVACLYQSSAE